MKLFRFFRVSFTYHIDTCICIFISWYRNKYIASRIKIFPQTTFRKLKVYLNIKQMLIENYNIDFDCYIIFLFKIKELIHRRPSYFSLIIDKTTYSMNYDTHVFGMCFLVQNQCICVFEYFRQKRMCNVLL